MTDHCTFNIISDLQSVNHRAEGRKNVQLDRTYSGQINVPFENNFCELY